MSFDTEQATQVICFVDLAKREPSITKPTYISLSYGHKITYGVLPLPDLHDFDPDSNLTLVWTPYSKHCHHLQLLSAICNALQALCCRACHTPAPGPQTRFQIPLMAPITWQSFPGIAFLHLRHLLPSLPQSHIFCLLFLTILTASYLHPPI